MTTTLAAALAFHISMSPPTIPIPFTPDPDPDTADNRRAIRATARFITAVLTKGLYWASAVTDTLVLLAPYVPAASSPALSPLSLSISIPTTSAFLAWIRLPTSGMGHDLPSSFPLPFLPPLPLVAIAGTTLAITGALLRRAAYRSLGQFYACPNLGTGHAHALITTGPYAFVRHPGYAGLVLCTTGLVVLHLDALKIPMSSSGVSSWGIAERVSVWMRTLALVCAILSTVGAVWRIRDEERALKARFKGEWEAWAERVQYKLFPGLH
ncbi:hypothetical protein J3R82DRAFT_2883 [Butyriboletus roseoflavus]|nr:hypothetical protein J3R82DRAFT_2883 [Butyriboletus roseoflavus]